MSINLHTIRKLIDYSLKNILVKAMFTLVFLRYCCPGKSVLSPAQWGTGSKRVKGSSEKPKKYSELVEIAWKVIDLQA